MNHKLAHSLSDSHGTSPSLGAIPKTVTVANPVDKPKRGAKPSGLQDHGMSQAQWTSTGGQVSSAKPRGDANPLESNAKPKTVANPVDKAKRGVKPSGLQDHGMSQAQWTSTGGQVSSAKPRGDANPLESSANKGTLDLGAATNPLQRRDVKREGDSRPSTSAPSMDPVNVVQPGWKSSQVSQGSGVFGEEGARQGEESTKEVKELPMFDDEEDIETEMILLTIRAEAEMRSH